MDLDEYDETFPEVKNLYNWPETEIEMFRSENRVTFALDDNTEWYRIEEDYVVDLEDFL